MPGFDYLKSQATALRLIQNFGQQLPIKRPTPGEYDPVEGEHAEADPDETTGTIDCVILPASKGTLEAFDIRLTDGLLLDNLRFLIVAAKTAPFRPQGTDLITHEGRDWTVMGCTPLDPAGTPLIYKVGMRIG